MRIIGYHITPRRNINKILSKGFIAKRPRDMKSDAKAVYCFYSIDDLNNALNNWYLDRYSENTKFAVFEVDISEYSTIEGAEYEHVIPNDIPANKIVDYYTISV